MRINLSTHQNVQNKKHSNKQTFKGHFFISHKIADQIVQTGKIPNAAREIVSTIDNAGGLEKIAKQTPANQHFHINYTPAITLKNPKRKLQEEVIVTNYKDGQMNDALKNSKQAIRDKKNSPGVVGKFLKKVFKKQTINRTSELTPAEKSSLMIAKKTLNELKTAIQKADKK